jgi:hypothetical protein
MKTYRFSSYRSFTEKEIDQLCNLVKLAGGILPIDRRHYTKNVISWALQFDLLYKGEEKRWPNDLPGKLYINTRFDIESLPIYALWKMVQPIIGNDKGYSISQKKQWEELNIYPASSRFHSERDFEQIFRIMVRLSMFHFINFQAGGSIWWVEVLSESSWQTDQF